tara:strand:- start:226 stop:357 length:132 start_codon:yes stop_codon:yes gene_type:complete
MMIRHSKKITQLADAAELGAIGINPATSTSGVEMNAPPVLADH